jgi:hypothetical protein
MAKWRALSAMTLVGLALSLSACDSGVKGVSHDATVAISPQFSIAAQADIVEAVDRWSSGTGGQIRLRVSIGGEGDVTVTPGQPQGSRVGETGLGDGQATIWLAADWALAPGQPGPETQTPTRFC